MSVLGPDRTVVIADDRTRLLITEPLGISGTVEYLTIAVSGPMLEASRQVYEGWSYGFGGLGTYFREMSEAWRGWTGERTYESIEHDLQLTPPTTEVTSPCRFNCGNRRRTSDGKWRRHFDWSQVSSWPEQPAKS